MTERTVTEQQVIDVFNIAVPLDQRIFLNLIFSELFPELPNQGELILVWDKEKNDNNHQDWLHFHRINELGNVVTMCPSSAIIQVYQHYRRQTPAERGEG
jgi:hypothetical protein